MSGDGSSPRAASLPDGTPVRIRPLEPGDAPLLREGMQRLSERSRRLRFHSAVSDLTDAQLRALVAVDQRDRLALVVDVPTDEGYEGVAVARYAIPPDGGPPEFAIVVEDAWQGRGVGRLLLRALFEAARGNGFEELTAEILAENDRMLRLLREEAPEVDLTRHGTSFSATVRL